MTIISDILFLLFKYLCTFNLYLIFAMHFNRRNFIRAASVLSALSVTEIQTLAATKEVAAAGKVIDENDEAYWHNVRQLFPLTRDWTYLNNGTFGPSPYPVI